MSLRTPLGKVRGLGSAKDGTEHFWLQRVTALALIPLTIWFLYFLVSSVGSEYATTILQLKKPLVAIPMLLLLITGFYHMKLGLQVVIEDYVTAPALKFAGLLLNTFACTALGLACVYAVLKIGFGG